MMAPWWIVCKLRIWFDLLPIGYMKIIVTPFTNID